MVDASSVRPVCSHCEGTRPRRKRTPNDCVIIEICDVLFDGVLEFRRSQWRRCEIMTGVRFPLCSGNGVRCIMYCGMCGSCSVCYWCGSFRIWLLFCRICCCPVGFRPVGLRTVGLHTVGLPPVDRWTIILFQLSGSSLSSILIFLKYYDNSRIIK